MMGDELISIITPSYNQSEFIEQNISSVYNQNYSNIEHIIIDGGSNDGTVDILEEYESEYNLQWVSEPDRGQSHAVNKGIDMAEGEWIGWQNSDDFYTPDALTIVANKFQNIQNIDVIYGDTVIVNEHGEEVDKTFYTRPSKFSQRYWSQFAGNQSLFVKQDILNELGGLDEDLNYTMDTKLTWELLQGDYSYECVPETLGAFRIQEDAKTFGDTIEVQQSELDEIYPTPWYEDYIPISVLEGAAKGVKAINLALDSRWDAFHYNLKKKYNCF